MPYGIASQVLGALNTGNFPSKRSLSTSSFGFGQVTPSLSQVDKCLDPPISHDHSHTKRSRPLGRIVRRQSTSLTPGYTTSDDFGTDGDDTPHSEIAYYSYPDFFQANASLPQNGTIAATDTVDLVFLDYIAASVITVLDGYGLNYSTADVQYYLPESFTTNSYLPEYATLAADWQADVPDCPVGLGIGYNATSPS